jgi:Protein of unknown function (DUF1822)
MICHSLNTTNLRLLLPETLWLEPKHFERAKEISDRSNDEPQQWQAYLNALAMLAFESWLKERLPTHYQMKHGNHEFVNGCYLKVGDFQLCVMATEHVLDEIIRVPKLVIEQPDLAAHFYVVVEVLEEQEQAIVRGFLQYNDLIAQANGMGIPKSEEFFLLPLLVWDAEINHLMVYIQHMNPSATEMPIALAQPTAPSNEAEPQHNSSNIRTRLSQWLHGVLDEGWQTVDTLINPEANLAWSTRNTSLGTKSGKLINLGMQLGDQAVILLVTVTPENEGKIGVNVQVLPAKGAQVLPPCLKLALFSALDKISQEVQSRGQDNYIQLKPFKGKPGTNFSVEVSLNNIKVREAFEL